MSIETKNGGDPMVSVIVPVFNGMSTLPGLLASLKKQDYPGKIEVILVDDGSDDGSGKFAEKQGFKVVYQTNKGPGVARNTGAKEASGDLLVFTDADCALDDDFITELTKPLKNGEIVGSQGVFYSNQKAIVSRFIQVEVLERYEREAKADHIDWIATYAACYQKDVFLDNGGFSNIYSSEDAEFSTRLGRKGYKMVLAPNAKCQHHNYENFLKFLRYKYKRAYWTIWLYRKFPGRIVGDKMTPSSRRNMMIVLALALAFLAAGIFVNWALYIGLILSVLYFLSTIPFSIKAWKNDRVIALWSPLFLTARTISYILGFAKGLFDYCFGRRSAKRSAAK